MAQALKQRAMPLRSIAVMVAVLGALAALLALLNRPEPPPVETRPPFVWSIEPEALRRVDVTLVREGKREAWVRRQNSDWHFDRPDGPKADEARWGLGIPLLLSGPRAARLIDGAIRDEQLPIYGLDQPRMIVALGLADGSAVTVHVGDPTPDGADDYVRLDGAREVYSVHRAWAEVIERLVRELPYPPRS